jgi:hypothetical protein
MPPRFAVRPTRPHAHRNSAQYSHGGGQGSLGHDQGWAGQAGQEESSYGRAPRLEEEEEEGWKRQQDPMKRPQDNRGHQQGRFAGVGNAGCYGRRMDDDNDDEMLEDETSSGYETGHRLTGNRGDEEMFLGSQGAEAHGHGYDGVRTFRHDRGEGYGGDGPRLRSVLDFQAPLPSLFSKVFSFDVFNSVQTAVCEKALSDNSLVVVSPTGSGKTVIFELAICSLFQGQMGQKRGNGERKAIFLAVRTRPCQFAPL